MATAVTSGGCAGAPQLRCGLPSRRRRRAGCAKHAFAFSAFSSPRNGLRGNVTFPAQSHNSCSRTGQIASGFFVANNNPVNNVDPSGLDPSPSPDVCLAYVLEIPGCPGVVPTGGPTSSKPSAPEFKCLPPGTFFAAYVPNSIVCDSGPLLVGTLRPGSSAAEARAAAADSNFDIPDDYVSEPARTGRGWIFRAPGTTGEADTVRVMEPNWQNPTGYVRYYDSEGFPLNPLGIRGPDSETHLPLNGEGEGDETPINPLEEGFYLGCSGVWV